MSEPTSFEALGLSAPVLKALATVGYESPSPIQAGTIPLLLSGSDVIGQAQTGTGKTAAFALPLLSQLRSDSQGVQYLVLCPTRELAIQVAEAFQSYARCLKGFHVLPIYGGQAYDTQLRQLRRGVQAVVGTPGRVMDHMRRGTLKLDQLKALVLDEADEMLRMGFIDDVEWILEQTPQQRQIALFSATMPEQIRKVANRHLNQPQQVRIANKTSTATTIRQRYWQVSGLHKLDALTRILESETFDAMLIFVRTKTMTVDLAERLTARGYACEALNGDIPQKQRERTVERLKQGNLDILIATDVAARGLDVERISHVVNYDIPYDTETYIHRIGRTGRAGRSGQAILFVAQREQRLLRFIERDTRQPIERMEMPTADDINVQRIERFKQRISETLDTRDLDLFEQLVRDYQGEHDVDPFRIAAALAQLSQGEEPLLLADKPAHQRKRTAAAGERGSKQMRGSQRALPLKGDPTIEMQRFRVEVGYRDEIKPSNLVGAIANEADLESRYIGHIEIYDEFTTVDLPAGMPAEIMQTLKKTRVAGKPLRIQPVSTEMPSKGKSKPAGKRKPNRNPGKTKRRTERSKTGKTKRTRA